MREAVPQIYILAQAGPLETKENDDFNHVFFPDFWGHGKSYLLPSKAKPRYVGTLGRDPGVGWVDGGCVRPYQGHETGPYGAPKRSENIPWGFRTRNPF